MNTAIPKEEKKEPSKSELEASYKLLKSTDDSLTKEIVKGTKARNDVRKQMRSIIQKLTTINLGE